jgi:hypothetical protein
MGRLIDEFRRLSCRERALLIMLAFVYLSAAVLLIVGYSLYGQLAQ